MSNLLFIFPDQLSHNLDIFTKYKVSNDVFICEDFEYFSHVKHHKKKIVFLISAMRHFAQELQERGYQVYYYKMSNKSEKITYLDCLKEYLNHHDCDKLVFTAPNDYIFQQQVQKCKKILKIPVEILEDNRFLCSTKSFIEWASNKKHLLMESFYRMLRKQHNILLSGNNPIGGKWNFDANNRKPAPKSLNVPQTYYSNADKVVEEVKKLVIKNFADNWGDIEPFHFAVTRDKALYAMHKFVKERLPNFGDYQDAMLEEEPWMFHSHISFYLNAGLLEPLECIKAAEAAYYSGAASLSSVEGFIRQIIGWREFIRGVYHLRMPGYESSNFFDFKRKLPDFFWGSDVKLNCISQVIAKTKKYSYAHHIERLMIIGNFCLLAEISPHEVAEWFLIVYADAFEWVELPNVIGMALFADGGLFATKPYISSGNYIDKMSNYCDKCSYKVNVKQGEDACPFNYLYWNFISNQKQQLSSNPRMKLVCSSYDKMSDSKKDNIRQDAQKFLDSLDCE